MTQTKKESQKLPRFERVGKHRRGYATDQVDAFLENAHAKYDAQDVSLKLEDIQNAAFRLVKDGYMIGQVDAALDRLAQAVSDRQTVYELSANGSEAWRARTDSLYHGLAEHTQRAAKQRFARGKNRKPSYCIKQVDQLVDMIMDKARMELGITPWNEKEAKKLADVNAVRVSNSIFTQKKGARGYDERQVDYYLACCSDLLNRMESYERLQDSVPQEDDSASTQLSVQGDAQGTRTGVRSEQPIVGLNSGSSVPVPPLFPGNITVPYAKSSVSGDDEPISFAPERDDADANAHDEASSDGDISFSDVHEEERAVFNSAGNEDNPVKPVASVKTADHAHRMNSSAPVDRTTFTDSTKSVSTVTPPSAPTGSVRPMNPLSPLETDLNRSADAVEQGTAQAAQSDEHGQRDFSAEESSEGNSSLAALAQTTEEKAEPSAHTDVSHIFDAGKTSADAGSHSASEKSKDEDSTDTEVFKPALPQLEVPEQAGGFGPSSGHTEEVPSFVDVDDWLFVPHDDELGIPNLSFPDLDDDDDQHKE